MRRAHGRDLALVDTNIVIYAHDPADERKHAIAKSLLRSLSTDGRLAYSTQVLNEYCAVMLRPNREPHLGPAETRAVIADLCGTGLVLPTDARTTRVALDAVARWSLSFWDALLWATAETHGVATIYTEDEQSAPKLPQVRYANPFVL